MRRVLLASVFTLAALPAMAWDPPPTTATANATARATGGAGGAGGTGGTATATQHQGQHQTATGGSVTINGGIGSGSGNANPAGDPSGGWNNQPWVASAIAPSFGLSGACTGRAASAAGQFQVFGLSFGGTDMDKACQSEHLGNLQTIGERIGFEVMCNDHEFRSAALRAHYACSADQQAAAPAPQPIAPTHTRPDWCNTSSPAELRRHAKECA